MTLLLKCYIHAFHLPSTIPLDVQETHQQATASDKPPADPTCPSALIKTLQYLPQALQYIAHNCKHLQELSLRLTQAASNNRGGVWDHPSLLKRPHFKLSQFCSQCSTLQSLVLVNIPSRYALIGSSVATEEAALQAVPGLQSMQYAAKLGFGQHSKQVCIHCRCCRFCLQMYACIRCAAACASFAACRTVMNAYRASQHAFGVPCMLALAPSGPLH